MSHVSESRQKSHPIRIIEVGPRDGLQNESRPLSLKTKLDFINALSLTGLSEIEAGAFVSPTAVPQMQNSSAVFRQLTPSPGVIYSALVPNDRGLDEALVAGVQKIAVVTAASNSFTLHNIRANISESLTRVRSVVSRAKQGGLQIRAYISTVIDCPYEGRIHSSQVVAVLTQLLDLGVDEIALGETLGKASPNDIRLLLDAVCSKIRSHQLVLHLHDTYGMAVANALTAWEEYGIAAFDASAGGLGGCPYAPGASGNVATEDLVAAFKASGAVVHVDEKKVVKAAENLVKEIGHELSSKLSKVLSPRPALAPLGG